MKINNENFVQQLILRNEKALEYVMEEYGYVVKTVVRKHLFSLPDYQDECINDIFFAVWENIESFEPERSSFKNWIAGISRYKSIDYKRKYLNKRETENLDDIMMGEEDRKQMRLLEQEISSEVDEMLECLNPEDRKLFWQLFVEERKPEEISSETGMKKEMIYNRVSRGKKKIRRLFGNKKGERSYD